jgi:hypothetical protein
VIGSTVTRTDRTERITLALDGAPSMGVSSTGTDFQPTGMEITYRSSLDGPGSSDVTILFGKVNGHYPTVTYWGATEERRPRPDWVAELTTRHAPDWWR